ncbi:hypothetical protein EDD86DRAFT_205577, partial [Gorgonomyces haynaldii]
MIAYPENINEFLSTIDISSPAVFGERVIFTEFDAPPNMPIKRQWFVDMIQIVASTLSVINLQQGTISAHQVQHFIPPRYWQDTGLKGHEFYLGRLKHHFYVSILFVPLDDCACHLRNKEEQMHSSMSLTILQSASIDSYQAAIAVNLKANPTGNVPKLCPALSQQDLMEMFAGNGEIYTKAFTNLFLQHPSQWQYPSRDSRGSLQAICGSTCLSM